MKIKTKKQMNLLELIQGVWEGNVKAGERKSDCGNTVFVWSHGFETYKGVRIQCDEVFTVEVEEELTEDTGIPGATFVYYYTPEEEVKAFSYSKYARPTISHITKLHHENKALAIYVGPTLIWSRESGISESGVLEVDE